MYSGGELVSAEAGLFALSDINGYTAHCTAKQVLYDLFDLYDLWPVRGATLRRKGNNFESIGIEPKLPNIIQQHVSTSNTVFIQIFVSRFRDYSDGAAVLRAEAKVLADAASRNFTRHGKDLDSACAIANHGHGQKR